MKKNISGKEVLKIIVEAAKNYDLKLKDKHFLIVYSMSLSKFQELAKDAKACYKVG